MTSITFKNKIAHYMPNDAARGRQSVLNASLCAKEIDCITLIKQPIEIKKEIYRYRRAAAVHLFFNYGSQEKKILSVARKESAWKL